MIYPINHLPGDIPVGVQTEQGVEVIGFDLKPWLDALPGMDFSVWHTRPGEKEAYPAKDQMMVGTVLYWHPDSYDTAIAGDGKVEIAGVGDNQRKLSGFVKTSIRATSLGTTKEPGENIPPWYEAVLQAAQDVKVDVNVGTGGLYLVRSAAKEGSYIFRTDRTIEEVREAVAAGKTCILVHDEGRVYTYCGEMPLSTNLEISVPTFVTPPKYKQWDGFEYRQVQMKPDGTALLSGYSVAKTPNPYKLTIGGVDYDGSKAVEVMPPPSDKSSAAYIRWNGTGYVPATVEAVKAELGGGGGTVEVDATLTKANTAADAKVVGDRFTSLSKEIEEINKDLDNIPTGKIAPDDTTFFLVFKNLFNPDTILEGYYINQAYGSVHASTSYNASDFIQIAPATTYVLNAGGESRYVFYDANRNFISGVYNTSEAPIEIVSPGNAEYFRFSFRKIRNLSDTSFAVAGIAAGDAPYINPEFIRLDTHSFPLNLPTKLYALVGEELNVWFDNIVDGHDTDYVFEVNCSVGMQLERCYRLTAEEAGEYNLTIKAIDKHGASVTKTTKIIVAEADAGSGDTASLIVLGDSTTNNGIAIDKLNANFMTDAEPMGVTTLGTRGEGRNKHEGRSGWTFRLYFESAGDDDDPSVVNPFYNPITQTFDATYYFANSGVTVPKWFFVNLGINDTFSYYDDETLATCIETLNTYCDQMITSLKAAAPSIKIGVCLTIPPNYSQDAFGKAYKCGQTRNRYKRNNVLWVENLIAKYDGREVENIYLVPIHTNLDTKYGMGMEEIPHSKRNTETYLSPVFNGGVHPETDGYWQIADVYWFFLKANA